MLNAFTRTELLLGEEALNRLKNSTVAVFGIGGVGSYAVEALTRCKVGRLILVDADDICLTNINRQIHATMKTVGMPKVEVMRDRILDINPDAKVITYKEFYNEDTSNKLLSLEYDYVVDAIDTVSSKIDLIVKCKEMGIPIISSMGAGNKLDPTKFEVADIYKTSVCPLAKVMRYELRKRKIESLKVVYSKEIPIKPKSDIISPSDKEETNIKKRQTPGSISFVPSVAGLIIAGEVIKDLIK
ncbi:tRNA A37 threonylcarbamoyladenosine dehydratase [Caloramator quimbayensis]|uniref:tRNA A37 threonylcarbamoyladenosine dehydratase n=1 Tax=Caloramator quimbayensis TaxID=1147123 RepID=A0A1T4WVH6_9CLOT|nr:tRNA threonylcarbamoyladenosine dehydratase [Caloramator quimbayensis]SKA81382.1 tRNA A37 threonylcarbamoyladenosine dehydratase [Caloramator quimbayensis]